MEWDLTNDTGRISEVLALAATDGPQTIVNGDRRYVVTQQPATDKEAKREPPTSFKEWLLNGPSLEGVDLTRDRSPDRVIEL